MSDSPYPTIDCWRIGERVLTGTHLALRRSRGQEATLLWLGKRATEAVVTTAICLVGAGVEAGAGYFCAAPEVVGAVTDWAKSQGLTLLGDVHSHPPGAPAVLSDWDRRHGVAVPEFLSIVAGNGAYEPPARWGWFVFDKPSRAYRIIDRREHGRRIVVDPEVVGNLYTADASGVRP